MSSGCGLVPGGFPDPTVPKVQAQEIKKINFAENIKLVVDTQSNGESTQRGHARTTESITKALATLGIHADENTNSPNSIKVIVNNISEDSLSLLEKGLTNHFTMGLEGSTIKDNLEMTVIVSIYGTTIKKTGIKHAVYTLIGSPSLPPTIEEMSVITARDKVIEQMLLKAFKELQNSGELSKIQPHTTASISPRA
jgi:hypothetical protein